MSDLPYEFTDAAEQADAAARMELQLEQLRGYVKGLYAARRMGLDMVRVDRVIAWLEDILEADG